MAATSSQKDIGKYGLLYVRASDPISWLASDYLNSHRQNVVNYTYLGFYYETMITGSVVYQVIIKSIFTASTPSWFENISLVDLIAHPIVEQIEIKPILTQEHTNQDIRTLILKFIEISDMPYDLFFSALLGSKVDITALMPLIPLVDKLITLIEKVLGLFNDKKCCSFGVFESEVFAKSRHVNLPEHDISNIMISRNSCYQELEPVINDFGKYIVNSIFKEPSIIKSIRQRNSGTLSDIHFTNLTQVIQLTNDSITNGYLACSSFKQTLAILQQSLDADNIPTNISLLEEDNDSKLLFVDASNDYDEYTNAIRSLQEEISMMSSLIKHKDTETTGVVDINVLINSANTLTKFSGIGKKIHPHRGTYSTNISVAVRPTPSTDITFRSNDNNLLRIHTRHFDISRYSNEQLLEILVAIDNQTSSDDTSFDKLRAAIIEQLYT